MKEFLDEELKLSLCDIYVRNISTWHDRPASDDRSLPSAEGKDTGRATFRIDGNRQAVIAFGILTGSGSLWWGNRLSVSMRIIDEEKGGAGLENDEEEEEEEEDDSGNEGYEESIQFI